MGGMLLRKILFKTVLHLLASVSLMFLIIIGGLFVMRQLSFQSTLAQADQLNKQGGISEMREVSLGGISQYIAIEGENRDNPVCLFLHGGPGLSLPYGISGRHQIETISSHCNVVYWDQRGAGKTFSDQKGDSDFTYEQLESDAKELIAYLREEFEQDKIYLVGYSWGSVLGLRLAKALPDQLAGYFGLSQVVNPKASERLLYEWLLEEFETTGHHHFITQLRQLGLPPYEKRSSQQAFQELLTQSNAYVKWNEGLPNVNVLQWFYQVFACPDLSIGEAYDTLFQASDKMLNQGNYWKQLQEVNLIEEIKQVQIPLYFVTGADDYICPVSLVEEFMNQVSSSEKELLVLEHSAHYFSVEDETKMYDWMKEKIKGAHTNETSDEEQTVGDVISNLLQ